ncbi:MAG TPA: hypothetical protein VGO93_24205 [Candidatus Xenobia bacterium]|jgi:mono/diheme cytochrome c family protein
MRKWLAIVGAAVLLTGCGGGSSDPNNVGGPVPDGYPQPGSSTFPPGGYPTTPPTVAQLLRGRYLVSSAGACNDCHFPETGGLGPDPTSPFWMSGFNEDPTINPTGLGAFAEGPIQSFAANLTPDVTGISNHSPLELFNGLTTGQHHHNFGLLCQPMDWPVYRNMTSDDKWAIVAYLKSIAPVNNPVSFAEQGNGSFGFSTQPPGPPLGPPNCNAFQPTLPTSPAPIPAYPAGNEIPVTNTQGPGLPTAPATLAQVLNGRYLVTSVCDCASCHGQANDDPNNPNWLAGYIDSPTLNPTNTGFFQLGPETVIVPNLTPDPTGLGSNGDGSGGAWTAQDIFNVLRTGLLPNVQQPPQGSQAPPNFVLPPMPWPSFRNMSDADLWSIVAYIQSLKPVHNPVQASNGPIPSVGFYFDQHGNPLTSPFPMPPYPTQQEINFSDPASDQ